LPASSVTLRGPFRGIACFTRLAAADSGSGPREVRCDLDLAEITGLPVTVDNDANCAAWGEWTVRAYADTEPFVFLSLGTDVGGSVVVGGCLPTGSFGLAGELGHLTVEPGGVACVCGRNGRLASYASGRAMLAHARILLAALPQTPFLMSLYVDGDLGRAGPSAACPGRRSERDRRSPARFRGHVVAGRPEILITLSHAGRVVAGFRKSCRLYRCCSPNKRQPYDHLSRPPEKPQDSS
jgi:hypothetical protein